MSVSIQKTEGQIWELRVSGVLKKSELDSTQASAGDEISRTGRIKLLVVLDHFEGWERGVLWGDMSFTATYGDSMERIAVVGDPRWETPVLMFIGAGLRRTPVKFFAREQEGLAREWLNQLNDQEQSRR